MTNKSAFINIIIGIITLFSFKGLRLIFTDILNEQEVTIYWAFSWVIILSILEWIGFTFKALSFKNHPKLLLHGLITYLGLFLYIILTSIPTYSIYFHLANKSNNIIILITTISIIRFFYYGYLIYNPLLFQNLKSKKITALSDITLTAFITFCYFFYLYWIVDGVNPDLEYTIYDILWSTLPALILFVPLKFPYLLEKSASTHNFKQIIILILSVLWIGFAASLQMYPL